jgi:hypothetical protein
MAVAVIPFAEMERPMVLREKRNASYKMAPYALAHFITLLPGTFLLALLSAVIMFFMTGFLGFGYFLLILWMCCLFAECFAFLMASLFPHFIIGLAVGLASTITQRKTNAQGSHIRLWLDSLDFVWPCKASSSSSRTLIGTCDGCATLRPIDTGSGHSCETNMRPSPLPSTTLLGK